MGNNSKAINQSQGLYVLVKEAVVPKEFETSKEEDVAVGPHVGPQGRCYMRTWQIGVFHPTEVAHRVFPFPNCKVFLHINYKFFPL